MERFGLSETELVENLDTQRPLSWPLSCFGPGINSPRQLFGGFPVEQSPEELRVLYYLGAEQGNPQAAVREMQRLKTLELMMD